MSFLNYIDNNPFIVEDDEVKVTKIESDISNMTSEGIEVELTSKRGSIANGVYYPNTKRVVVKGGSRFIDYIKPSNIKFAKVSTGERNFIERFEELKRSDKVEKVGEFYILQKDISYKSPSGAGRTFVGGTCNG